MRNRGGIMLKLLIADDELKTREGISTLISNSNIPLEIIGTVGNGIDALSIAQEQVPDIIITDVRMPKLDGIKLSFEIKKINPNCQIIFISGYSDKEYLKSAITLKAIGYVEKPIDSKELLDTVKAAVDLANKEQRKALLLLQDPNLLMQPSNILIEKIALDLVHPPLKTKQIDHLQSLLPNFFDFSSYCTLIYQFQYKENPEVIFEDVYSYIKEFLGRYVYCYLSVQKSTNLFVFHLSDPKLVNKDTFKEFICQISFDLISELKGYLKSFITVGNVVTTPNQIYESYTNASSYLKNLFFMGYDHISFYNEKAEQYYSTYKLKTDIIKNYTACLKQGKMEEVQKLIFHLFSDIKKTECKYEINSIKNAYYQLLVLLKTICEENKLDNVFTESSTFIWEIIAGMDTLFDLHNYLVNLVNNFSIEISNKEGTSFLVYSINKYIEEHFSQSTLSINEMAKQLHFTPAYLCQVYKQKEGITINAHINNYRIKVAKELLRNKEVKLYEISCRVGYNDPNYFSRQFKKQTGMTPSEFRERYIK